MEKVMVTGGTGLVGTSINCISKNYKYKFIYLSSKDGDLTNYEETKNICKFLAGEGSVVYTNAALGVVMKLSQN